MVVDDLRPGGTAALTGHCARSCAPASSSWAVAPLTSIFSSMASRMAMLERRWPPQWCPTRHGRTNRLNHLRAAGSRCTLLGHGHTCCAPCWGHLRHMCCATFWGPLRLPTLQLQDNVGATHRPPARQHTPSLHAAAGPLDVRALQAGPLSVMETTRPRCRHAVETLPVGCGQTETANHHGHWYIYDNVAPPG